MTAPSATPGPGTIRPATPADTDGVVGLAVSSGLFDADEVDVVRDLLGEHFAVPEGERAAVCLLVEDPAGRPLGVAFAEPVPVTSGTWELTMIAVDRRDQGRGRGTALLREVERRLGADGGRLLLVQTSGTDDFTRTRAFYAGLGYGEEARVRDYYAAGVDMVLFRRTLDR